MNSSNKKTKVTFKVVLVFAAMFLASLITLMLVFAVIGYIDARFNTNIYNMIFQ